VTGSPPEIAGCSAPSRNRTEYPPSSSLARSTSSRSCAWRRILFTCAGATGSSPLISATASRTSSALTGCSEPPRLWSACLISPNPRENPPRRGASAGAAGAGSARDSPRSPLRPPPPPLRPRSPRSRAAGRSTTPPSGCARAPGTSGPRAISNWPLSRLVSASRPLFAASATNLLKRENPASFSSNVGSISYITCFSRSDRITSLCAVICLTASTTSSHGSRRGCTMSLSLVRPASSL